VSHLPKIIASFFFRVQPLICFSTAIAWTSAPSIAVRDQAFVVFDDAAIEVICQAGVVAVVAAF
jgi:hypothetical protein